MAGGDPDPVGKSPGPMDERPGSCASFVAENGNGESSMMDYVRNYMMGILTPYATSVDELRTSVANIADDVVVTLKTTAEHGELLQKHKKIIAGLRSDVNGSMDRISKLESELEITNEQKAALASDHETVKRHVAKLDERLDQAHEHLTKLDQGLTDTDVRLGKLNEVQSQFKRVLGEDVQPALQTAVTDLACLDNAHKRATNLLYEVKASLDNNIQDHKGLAQKFEAECENNTGNLSDLDTKLRTVDTSVTEAHSQLKSRLEHNREHDKAIQSLIRRLETQWSAHAHEKERQDLADSRLTEHDSQTHDMAKSIDKLLAFEKKFSSRRDLTESVDELSSILAERTAEIKRLKDELATLATKLGNEEGRILSLEAGFQQGEVRFGRLEKSVGISKMSIPEKSTMALREVFMKFDKDGTGIITTAGLSDVMIQLGMAPSEEFLTQMVDWVDSDGSGVIEFSEFCSMMGDILGPDGDVDPKKLTPEYAIESMSLKAKNKSNGLTIVEHTEQIRTHHQDIEQLKGLDLKSNLQKLWTEQATTNRQLEKLRQGLELTQEYWKGMTKGLRETKMTAKQEGERMQKSNKIYEKGTNTPTLPAIAQGLSATHPSYPSGSTTARG